MKKNYKRKNKLLGITNARESVKRVLQRVAAVCDGKDWSASRSAVYINTSKHWS